MIYRTEAIIIRSMDYGEGNKIVTLLTDSIGKVGVLVRGAKKLKSRHGSLAQLFTYGEFVFFRGSGLATLNDGEIIASHHSIRESLDAAAYASYASELIDRAFQDEEAGRFMFEQLKAFLQALEEGKDPAVTLSLLEMKVLQASGYSPVVHACASCGREAESYLLSPRLGGFVCQPCSYQDRQAYRMSEGLTKLLRLFSAMDLRRLGSINVKPATKQELKTATRLLLDTHLSLQLRSRSFLDSLEALQPPEGSERTERRTARSDVQRTEEDG